MAIVPLAAAVISLPSRYSHIAGESGNRRFVMSNSLNGCKGIRVTKTL